MRLLSLRSYKYRKGQIEFRKLALASGGVRLNVREQPLRSGEISCVEIIAPISLASQRKKE